tara:strand:+ start:121 stop:1485 length:1365 start_codon:yes stop_codon:yes gene_type:complete
MAITTKVEPQDVQPAYNENIFVFDSTNKNQGKFEYIVKIEIGGSDIANLKIQSNPQGFGIVNVSKHLQNYISYDLPSTNVFQANTNSSLIYILKVAERFTKNYTFTNVADNGGSAKITINDHSLAVGDFVTISAATEPAYNGIHEVISVEDSNNFTIDKTFSINSSGILVRTDGGATTQDFETIGTYEVLNNVIKHNDVWNDEDYEMFSSNNGKFLTNLPYDFMIREEDMLTLNYLDSLNNFLYVKFTTNEGNSRRLGRPLPQSTIIGVGIENLKNTLTNSEFNSLSFNTADWYTVELLDSSFNTISELKRFTIDRTCGEGTTLTYLNTGGSWSVFHFWGARSKQVSNDKTKYRKNVGAYDGVSTYGYAKSDRGTTTVHTEVKEVHTINTLYLRPNEGDLITDLINSPEVYEVVNNELIAIDIDTNSVKVKQRKIDKLISYTLNFQYANKNLAQ